MCLKFNKSTEVYLFDQILWDKQTSFENVTNECPFQKFKVNIDYFVKQIEKHNFFSG